MIKNRRWFDVGAAAFSRNWPNVLSHPGGPYYFCPLCLHGYSERDLADGRLSVEHVPAEAVGGGPLCLTCKPCNDHFGHAVEPHVREHEDWYQFMVGGAVARRRATLTLGGHAVPVRFRAEGRQFHVSVEGRAARPQVTAAALEAVKEYHRAPTADFDIKLSMGAYDPALVASGWVKSALLAFFAALGYAFVVRPELQPVREELRRPSDEAPSIKAAYRFLPNGEREKHRGRLLIVDAPDAVRSFLFRWGPHQVLLPRFGDVTLYERLAALTDDIGQASGREIPWPTHPTHRWDRSIR